MNIDKDLLKNLIFADFKALALIYKAEQDSYFSFTFDKQYIYFKATVACLSGGDCWGSEQKKINYSIKNLGEYDFTEVLNQLFLEPENSDQLIDYYDNFPHFDYSFYESHENSVEDYYNNYDIVRTIQINVDEIAEKILSFKYTTPLETLKSVFNHINFDKETELQVALNATLLDKHLIQKENKPRQKI